MKKHDIIQENGNGGCCMQVELTIGERLKDLRVERKLTLSSLPLR